MRIAVMTDIHANLPALQAALADMDQRGCDLMVHTGDAIAIGPFPAECLDVLFNLPQIRFVMGNHDDWFVHGLPQPQPDWLSDGEKAHQEWTHAQIDSALRVAMAQWPFVIAEHFAGTPITFMHYGLDAARRTFATVVRQPTAVDLDAMFAGYNEGALLFYGHDHAAADISGRTRYVNPGALGCHTEATARYVMVDCDNGRFSLTPHAIPYDDTPLFRAYEQRRVPEREFIQRIFLGNRYKKSAAASDGRPRPKLRKS